MLLKRFGEIIPVELFSTEMAIVTTGHLKNPTAKIKGNYMLVLYPDGALSALF